MLLHFFCRWHCQLLVDGVGRKLPAGEPNTVTYRVLVTNHLLSANQVDISPLVSRKEFLCNRHSNWWTERGRRGWQNTDSAICSRFKQFILKIDPAGGINQSPWQQQSDPSTTDPKRQHKHSPWWTSSSLDLHTLTSVWEDLLAPLQLCAVNKFNKPIRSRILVLLLLWDKWTRCFTHFGLWVEICIPSSSPIWILCILLSSALVAINPGHFLFGLGLAHISVLNSTN